MRTFKRALWVSFLMNIVLAYCFYRQNQDIQEAKRREAVAIKGLQRLEQQIDEIEMEADENNERLAELDQELAGITQQVRDHNNRLIFMNDQTGAFLEERGIYGDS